MSTKFDRHVAEESPDQAGDVRLARLSDRRRLQLLRNSGLVDGVADPVLDRIARLTAGMLGVPIALVTLVDDQRQHFPGLAGLAGLAGAQRGTTLSYSFCQHVVTKDAAFVVSDASLHPLVMDNLAVKDFGLVAYVGVPLRTEQGATLGALCAIDVHPVQWTPTQIALLEDLAAIAMAEIALRATAHALAQSQARFAAQADRDALTGLLNRQGFAARSREQYTLAQQTGTPFSIVAVSLMGFRGINAAHGHDVGDHALIDMAALLSTVVQNGHVVARTGGDEFTLMLTEPRHEQAAIQKSIDTALALLNAEIGREYDLQASVGVAQWSPDTPHALATLRQRADDAMVAQKRRRHASSAPVSPRFRGARHS